MGRLVGAHGAVRSERTGDVGGEDAVTKLMFSKQYFETATVEDVSASLLSGPHPEATDECGRTILHFAAGSTRYPAVVEMLIADGTSLEAQDHNGCTPLHYSAEASKSPAVVGALVDAGANLEAKHQDGKTAFHIAAACNGNPAIIKVLIKALVQKGKGLEAKSKHGLTALHEAAWLSNNAEVIDALLDAGMNPTAHDKYYRTPWELIKDRERLKGSDAYGRLQETES